MNPMKQLEWLAVLVVGATLLASAPAKAKPKDDGHGWSTIELANTGDEPNATGQATVENVKYEGNDGAGNAIYSIKASVSCQNLTPGATYRTPLGSFTANRKGEGNIRGTVVVIDTGEGHWDLPEWFEWLLRVTVYRLNTDGSSTLVLYGSW
jgi:hypothetical protein